MRIVILANQRQKEEWLAKPQAGDSQLNWVAKESELLEQSADAYFNLIFQTSGDNIDAYSHIAGPVFLNEVIHPLTTLKKIDTPLFRLNAWPGFLKREILELASFNKEKTQTAESVFARLGWKFKWVPDIPGFITARVIATIINEAYFTLEQEVSTKQEIDIAMKLGTNYPYGPFEWSELIGLENIYQLLVEMSKKEKKYLPSELLHREAEQQMTWH